MIYYYVKSTNEALLNKELFYCCLSRILTIAIKQLVCWKPSYAVNHVLDYIYPLKNIIIARYIDQNKMFGYTDFQYYYTVDTFAKPQWCPL